MPDLWDERNDDEIWWDVDKVKKRLNELSVQNTREDIQQWMNRCLWWAAWNGQFAVCEHLVGQGGDPTWTCGCCGNTAIHEAAWRREHSRILQVLMDGGWSPDVIDNNGLTPLWWAGYFGHKDCVKILLSRGADPLYKPTQLHGNISRFSHEVLSDDSPLAVATKCNHCDIIALMQEIIKARTFPFVQQMRDQMDRLKRHVAECDIQLKAQDETISGLECQREVCQTRIVSLEEQLKCAVEGSDSSRLREEISYLKGERSAMLSEIQHLRSLSYSRTSQGGLGESQGSTVGDAEVTSHSSSSACVPSHSLAPQQVLSVVQQQSSCRWYPLGRAMGLSSDQLHMFGTRFVYDCDKLQAVFDEKAKEVGEVPAANVLLQACCSIQNPTIGAIEQELKKRCGCSSV